MSAGSPPPRLKSRLSAFAVGAALVAALLVPVLVLVLAGASIGSQAIDGHAAGDAAGTASAAVGGAQRLLTRSRDFVPVEIPALSHSVLAPIGTHASQHDAFEPTPRCTGPGFAAVAAAESRRF